MKRSKENTSRSRLESLLTPQKLQKLPREKVQKVIRAALSSAKGLQVLDEAFPAAKKKLHCTRCHEEFNPALNDLESCKVEHQGGELERGGPHHFDDYVSTCLICHAQACDCKGYPEGDLYCFLGEHTTISGAWEEYNVELADGSYEERQKEYFQAEPEDFEPEEVWEQNCKICWQEFRKEFLLQLREAKAQEDRLERKKAKAAGNDPDDLDYQP
jgi:hypothetical protein